MSEAEARARASASPQMVGRSDSKKKSPPVVAERDENGFMLGEHSQISTDPERS